MNTMSFNGGVFCRGKLAVGERVCVAASVATGRLELRQGREVAIVGPPYNPGWAEPAPGLGKLLLFAEQHLVPQFVEEGSASDD